VEFTKRAKHPESNYIKNYKLLVHNYNRHSNSILLQKVEEQGIVHANTTQQATYRWIVEELTYSDQ
jgi:hypothetical protein